MEATAHEEYQTAPAEEPPASTAIEVVCVSDDAGVARLAEEWAAEKARFGPVSLFQDIEHLALMRRERSEDIRILVARRAGRLVGFAGFAAQQGPFALSFGLKTVLSAALPHGRLIGGDIAVAQGMDTGTDEAAVVSALMRRLGGEGLDLLIVDECLTTSRLVRRADALAPYAVKTFDASNVTYDLNLPESFEAYLKGRKGKTRNTFKRRVRVFNEAFAGGARLEKVHRPEQVDGFIEAVEAIYARSWKLGVLTDEPTVSKSDASYLKALAARGWLRSYVLYGDDQPVAFLKITQGAGVAFLHDVAYDQAQSKLAPGVVALLLAIDDLCTTDAPAQFSMGYGDNKYKQLLCDSQREANVYYVVRPYSKAWALVKAQRGLRRTYHAARWAAVSLKLDERLRRVLKKRPATPA